MEQLIGNKIYVSLKDRDETLSGLLIHVEEHYVYIQMEGSTHFYVVPKDNVSYYVSDRLPKVSRVLPDTGRQTGVETEEPPKPTSLEVYINTDLVANIPVPPTFNLDKFSDDTMKVVLGNPDVQAILAGRPQKSLEYSPGKVYITTVGEDEDQNPDLSPNSDSPNTFSMGASGSPASQYMTGPQMVKVINDAVRRGNKA